MGSTVYLFSFGGDSGEFCTGTRFFGGVGKGFAGVLGLQVPLPRLSGILGPTFLIELPSTFARSPGTSNLFMRGIHCVDGARTWIEEAARRSCKGNGRQLITLIFDRKLRKAQLKALKFEALALRTPFCEAERSGPSQAFPPSTRPGSPGSV